MGRQTRLAWVAKGSPFRLMQPARDLRDILRKHGYTVYDIGNQAHLEANPPEDHTPYSATGYPGKAQYGVGYALDIMPPTKGQRSKVDGSPLPSLQQLGAQLLADRKANVAGIRWLKYMNWEPERNNGGLCYQESWTPAYRRRSSTDRGHIHASGLTGYETSTVGRDYDPVARLRGDDEMSQKAEQQINSVFAAYFKGGSDMGRPVAPAHRIAGRTGNSVVEQLAEVRSALTQIQANQQTLAGKDWVDEQQIVDGVLAGLGSRDLATVATALRAAMGPDRAAELGERLTAPSS